MIHNKNLRIKLKKKYISNPQLSNTLKGVGKVP